MVEDPTERCTHHHVCIQSDYDKNRNTPAPQRGEPCNNYPLFRNAHVGSLSAEISQIFTDEPVVSARKVTNAVFTTCCSVAFSNKDFRFQDKQRVENV